MSTLPHKVMNSNCLQLLNQFCASHAIELPDPDERGHYQLGCDQVEVILFEDLGSLYLLAQLTAIPDKPDERASVVEKACSYLYECILNVHDVGGVQYLILVTVMTDPNPNLNSTEEFENRISGLVDRAEALIAHLEETMRTKTENRFAIFRP